MVGSKGSVVAAGGGGSLAGGSLCQMAAVRARSRCGTWAQSPGFGPSTEACQVELRFQGLVGRLDDLLEGTVVADSSANPSPEGGSVRKFALELLELLGLFVQISSRSRPDLVQISRGWLRGDPRREALGGSIRQRRRVPRMRRRDPRSRS